MLDLERTEFCVFAGRNTCKVAPELERRGPFVATERRGDYKSLVPPEYLDSADYSSDGTYRWWYERRWGDGPRLCWVGLNPGTGDTDGKPRPTLRKVVIWATEWHLDAVLVVNLFAYRATNPKALRTVNVDVIGDRNDEILRWATSTAGKTSQPGGPVAGWPGAAPRSLTCSMIRSVWGSPDTANPGILSTFLKQPHRSRTGGSRPHDRRAAAEPSVPCGPAYPRARPFRRRKPAQEVGVSRTRPTNRSSSSWHQPRCITAEPSIAAALPSAGT
jgi:hypothetical protein